MKDFKRGCVFGVSPDAFVVVYLIVALTASFTIAFWGTGNTYFPENYLVTRDFEKHLDDEIRSEWNCIEADWFTATKQENGMWRIYVEVRKNPKAGLFSDECDNAHLTYNFTSKEIFGEFSGEWAGVRKVFK